MTLPCPEFPNDVSSCHDVIRRLHADAQRASELGEKWRSKAEDADARIIELETLLAKHEQTIADQQQTIEQLSADNKLLKRSLFGSRRERFTDDPLQLSLFDLKSIEPESPQQEADFRRYVEKAIGPIR